MTRNIRQEIQSEDDIARKKRADRRATIIIISVLTLIVLIMVGAFYYKEKVAPFRQVVETVDGTPVYMGSYLKRIKSTGATSSAMLQQMADEVIVKKEAPALGITVTTQEVDNALLAAANADQAGGSSTGNITSLSQPAFKTWYAQQRAAGGFTDAEYRDLTRTNLLAGKLRQYLAQQIPTVAEQVHLNVIITATSADATAAKQRIDNGESFADVARQVSTDNASRASGGDLGWIPQGVLPFDSTIFSLKVGQVSAPIQVGSTSQGTTQYAIFMVSEIAKARQIDASNMQILQSRALVNWLNQEVPKHKVVIKYDFNNTANQAWINWQLTK